MSIYTPFTYVVKFKPTGQIYYGSRTKQGCQPTDLWTSYYTSSKVVRQLIEQHGKDAFEVEIRKTFSTKEQALLWEHRVLRRVDAARNPLYLNKNNGDRKFYGGCVPKGFRHSEDARRRMSINSSGEKNPNWGKTFSEETRRKISEAAKKRKDTLEMRLIKKERIKGEKNPNFGKKFHWWNNGEVQKQIETHLLPPDGWVRGRLWSPGHREKMEASRWEK